MGYHTEFNGSFQISPPLSPETAAYLKKFSETRRVKRKLPPEYGIEGEFYVDGAGFMGQDRTPDVIDHNAPPRTQPGLWCQWVPNTDGTELEWDGGEKFYDYVKWLKYLINNFLTPKGHVLSGRVYWVGEDPRDRGVIKVEENRVMTARGEITYGEFGDV